MCGDWQQIASPSLDFVSPRRSQRRRDGGRRSERLPTPRQHGSATTTGRVFISKNVGCRAGRRGHVDAPRLARGATIRTVSSAASTSSPTNAEPRVDLLQRLQRLDARDTWACVRGDLQPDVPARRPGSTAATTSATSRSPTSLVTTSTATSTPRATSASSASLRARRVGPRLRPGMPNVEVAGLTIVPAARKLYVATHGLGAWLLNLP